MKTFQEFVAIREGNTVTPNQNTDDQVDDEIANNPQLLKPQSKPGQDMMKNQSIINQAIQKRKTNPRVSFDAALKASAMATNRLK